MSYTGELINMKETAIEVLKHAKRQGVTAFIGGGFVRDTLLKREPKDIDIFVLSCSPFFKLFNLPYSVYGSHTSSGGSGDNLREDVTMVEKYEMSDLDIIYLDQPTIESACYNFDMSICQCYAILSEDESDLVYYVTSDWFSYYTDKIIYQYSNIQTTESHVERVKQKYPDAEFKIKPLYLHNNEFHKVSL